MSAEPQYSESETPQGVPAALNLTAVRERRTLRVVGGAEPQPSPEQEPRPARRRRAPLAAAPEKTAARRRIPWVMATLLAVIATLCLVLLLNISMSSNQYDLVQLRSQEQTLKDENQSLSEEIEYQQAPQNLAERASSLGMVAGLQQAQVNLKTQKIEGTPQPAQPLDSDDPEAKYSGQENLVEAPKDSDTDAATEAAQRKAAKEAEEKKAAQKKADEKKAQADKKASNPEKQSASTPAAEQH